MENITCGYGNHLWNIEFITRGFATRDKFNISLVITITTRDIFQYFLPAIVYYPNTYLKKKRIAKVKIQYFYLIWFIISDCFVTTLMLDGHIFKFVKKFEDHRYFIWGLSTFAFMRVSSREVQKKLFHGKHSIQEK